MPRTSRACPRRSRTPCVPRSGSTTRRAPSWARGSWAATPSRCPWARIAWRCSLTRRPSCSTRSGSAPEQTVQLEVGGRRAMSHEANSMPRCTTERPADAPDAAAGRSSSSHLPPCSRRRVAARWRGRPPPRSPRRNVSDPDAITDLAASLGHDPERIFRWVQEEIRYEPYAGHPSGRSRHPPGPRRELRRPGGAAGRPADSRRRPRPIRDRPLDGTTSDALMATTVVEAETARLGIEQAVLSEADLAAGIHPDIPPADRPSASPRCRPRSWSGSSKRRRRTRRRWVASRMTSSRPRSTQLMAALAPTGVTLPMGMSPMPELERAGTCGFRRIVGRVA